MDTVNELLGSPNLPTALLLAGLLWAAVRLIELAVETYARRIGWTVTADPAELVRLDEVIELLQDQRDLHTAVWEVLEERLGAPADELERTAV